jgi:Ca-activated chloride channel family protein
VQTSRREHPKAGNTFVDEGVGGYVDAAVDPRSTFALDVDDGSYRIAEAYVARGLRPPPASVRTEEWVNAFPYADPAPTDADLAVRAESGVRPGAAARTQVVRVAVTARDVAVDDRPPVNLTLVVDRSGSMGLDNRIGLVQDSLALLAESLQPADTVSVVGFDSRPELVLPPTRVSDDARIMGAVDELSPRGSTNLAGGLTLGFQQARRAYRGINVVVLCSDGVANVGVTGPDGILADIAEAGHEGIHLVTVGFGMGNYDDHLMEQLADRGDGFYRYVDTHQEAEHVFVDELTAILAPVADDARVQVSFDPELVPEYRLIGYENRAMDDESFEDLSATPGSWAPGSTRRLSTRCGWLLATCPVGRSDSRRWCGSRPAAMHPVSRSRSSRSPTRTHRCRSRSPWRRRSRTSPRP